MTVEALTSRVDRVEISMDDLRHIVAATSEAVHRLSWRVEQTSQGLDRLTVRMDQLAVRVDQTSASVDQLTVRVDQTSASVDRLTERMDQLTVRVDQTSASVELLSQEMREFKQEMREAEQRSEQEHKRFRQELAHITFNMGRMAEDLVAPSMPGILAQIIGCEGEPQMRGVRIRKQAEGRSKEYDVLAICGEYLLITEVKNRLRTGDVDDLRTALQEARTFLPEYAEKQIIGALATFYVDETQVRHAERQGLVVLGVVDGLMQVLNQDGFQPQCF